MPFEINEEVLVKDPGLPIKEDEQFITCPKGHLISFHWGSDKAQSIGKTGRVFDLENAHGMVGVNVLTDEIWGTTNMWYFHPNWLDSTRPKKCTCSIDVLMASGCKCGQFQREMEAKS